MISHDELIRVLNYDQETGIWTWLVKVSDKVVVGKRAGHRCRTNGYWYIKIFGERYASAPLAWFYMTEEWPFILVDHKNLIKTDDRWENLRLATHSQNRANVGLSKTNSTGIKGVRLYRNGRFSAQIQVNRRHIHLGYFDSKEEAGEAYKIASQEHFGLFARTIT